MRSSFLLRNWQGHTVMVCPLSQSLLNEVFFPTYNLIERRKICWLVVAIPSKWGLLSYIAHVQVGNYILLSQSLLNEVFFPTQQAMVWQVIAHVQSQSLLNEVFFPTPYRNGMPVHVPSQSLLNEVFFPTHLWKTWNIRSPDVAIPSKWGLLSYNGRVGVTHGEDTLVAIPSKWGLLSYANSEISTLW